MRLREDLRSRLAHDIKSPLAAIVGYAELLRLRDDEEIRREAPEAIVTAARKLSAAVDALVDTLGRPVPDDLDGQRAVSRLLGLSDGPRRQVVIADDDALVRSLLRTTLPIDKFDVLEAADGQAALRLIEGIAPSLVLLDWRMPRRSGADVLAELKARVPDVPVIVLTAERELEQRELAEQLGADVFMTKPFSPLRLLEAVEALLCERPRDR